MMSVLSYLIFWKISELVLIKELVIKKSCTSVIIFISWAWDFREKPKFSPSLQSVSGLKFLLCLSRYVHCGWSNRLPISIGKVSEFSLGMELPLLVPTGWDTKVEGVIVSAY